MDLKIVAAISGKTGLYKIIKPTRTGLIVETLDNKKTRTAIGANSKVSILKEVSMYTTDGEGSAPLPQVLYAMFVKFEGKTTDISLKIEDAPRLFEMLKEVLPNADTSKIYHSDLKKLVSWYNILVTQAPEVFETMQQDGNEAQAINEAKETPQETEKNTEN